MATSMTVCEWMEPGTLSEHFGCLAKHHPNPIHYYHYYYLNNTAPNLSIPAIAWKELNASGRIRSAVQLLAAQTGTILPRDHQDISNMTSTEQTETGATLVLAVGINQKVFIYSHLRMSKPSNFIFDGNLTAISLQGLKNGWIAYVCVCHLRMDQVFHKLDNKGQWLYRLKKIDTGCLCPDVRHEAVVLPCFLLLWCLLADCIRY